jgi:septum site-determining protein MinC
MRRMTQAIPFELEGMVSTVTVLRLLTDDLKAVRKGLINKIEQMPGFFQDAPVALDLSALEGMDDDPEPLAQPREIPLAALAGLLRELKLVPVGIRHLREARRQEARAIGLGFLRGSGRKAPKPRDTENDPSMRVANAARAAEQRRDSEELPEPPPPRREELPLGSIMFRAPLRSGQVVYAEQCDAVVLAHVNPGAEIIADGNIHVYGSLRGRALAGAHGNEEARIFCKSLEADLVAIAGCYLRSDEIPEARRGKPAQIYLEKDRLVIADL